MEQLLFKNVRAIVTCDPTDQVFYDSDLLVEGPAISQIGKNLNAPGAKVIDCRGSISISRSDQHTPSFFSGVCSKPCYH